MTLGDTIAAIATAPGRGGVAVVRVSGVDAFAVAERVSGARPKPGRFRLRPVRGPDGREVDRALVLGFAAPRSYTGEDVVEFQCHGGGVTPRRVLEACLAAGARMAGRGEFTRRAYLLGRLDYEQARGVLDLVDAKTDRAADSALERLSGVGSRVARALYDEAVSLSAEVEHALDVDEGELPADFLGNCRARIAALRKAVESAVGRVREGIMLRDGALVVLAGPPNVGKSSLLNALLGSERAIVSPSPGTTRDSIEEWLDVDGWPVRLVDTAGMRGAEDAVEAEGVRRAERLAVQADVLLSLSCEGLPVAESPAGAKTSIVVWTKCDLCRGPGLNVSSATGEGLGALRAAIAERLAALAAEPSDGGAGAPETAGFLEALALFPPDGPRAEADLVTAGNALRAVAEKLGSLVGAVYSADMLERLFSRFCVGK